jgi:hypothetical protein
VQDGEGQEGELGADLPLQRGRWRGEGQGWGMGWPRAIRMASEDAFFNRRTASSLRLGVRRDISTSTRFS